MSYFDIPITLIGRPFRPIGRGEDLRSCYRALKAVGLLPLVVNADAGRGSDHELEAEIGPALREGTAGGVDIFVINGDEVELVLGDLGARHLRPVGSVVYPVWELSEYPETWARQLERFDEVWVPSVFIRDAVAQVVQKPVKVFPWSKGVRLGRFLGRRYFGIPESVYAFLFGFDLGSYMQRKNPFAIVQAFAEAVRVRPAADAVLVIKVAGSIERQAAAQVFYEELRTRTKEGLGRIVLIDRDLTDTETKNLVRCCDCFVSLHRSEGFGHFLAEAMLLGKPVIATGYSGNLEFMNPDVSCLVGFTLVPVAPGAYPFGEGQVWADADVDEAASWMVRLLDDPDWGRQLGERASRHIRTSFCYRAVGLQYLEGLRDLHERLGSPKVTKAHSDGPNRGAPVRECTTLQPT